MSERAFYEYFLTSLKHSHDKKPQIVIVWRELKECVHIKHPRIQAMWRVEHARYTKRTEGKLCYILVIVITPYKRAARFYM